MNITITSRKKESGSAIVLVISIMATLMVIVGIALEYTAIVNRGVQRSNTLESAIAIGDGCIDQLFAYWRETSRGNSTIPMSTSYFTSIPLPTQTQFPTVPNFTAKAGVNPDTSDEYASNFTVSNYKVVAVDPEWNSLPSATVSPTPGIGQSTTSATYNYIASADVTLPALRGNLVAKVRRVFQKQQLSPWNWAIFYVDPLEIHPGPLLNVTGWVNTNSNLYTGHNTLNFLDKVTYAGDWFIGFKPGDGTHPEVPTSPTWPSNLPPARDTAQQPFGLDSTRIFSTTDTNPNNDSYHELIDTPVAGYTDPLASQRYFNQASVAISVDASNNVKIGTPNPDGTITPFAITNPLYLMFNGAITTNQTIQDNREQSTVRLATLDVSKLINPSTGAYKSSSFNGVVYMYDNSAAANGVGAKRGIRIQNGASIPNGGLTVASANPVYLQGDFNTGIAPPSNIGDPTTPQGIGYTRQPCSIIADAVNVLSNSWNDANSFAGVSSRVAGNTTVNTAIVSGIVPTAPVGGDGHYSGGAENFPRFLENWSGKSLTYYGSMVELYQSKQSIGTWGKSNVYSPPVRQWYFDTNFRIYTPPGSLMVYSYVKGRWSML